MMEGVRTVRLVAALAVAAMLAGGWMMNAPVDDITDTVRDDGGTAHVRRRGLLGGLGGL